jgi:hypothetical protein
MFHGLLRHAAFEALGVSKTAAVAFAQLEHAAVTRDNQTHTTRESKTKSNDRSASDT